MLIMMRLSVSVPFCVLCQCTRVIFATRLSTSVTARTCPISDWEGLALAVRWGIVARYRGHEVCCIADSGDELSRAEQWLAPSRAHPQTRTGPDARSVRLLLVHHLRADTGAQHEHQNGPEDHEQHHAEGGQHLRQRVLERLVPELSRRRQRQLGFATGRGQARRRGCRWGRRLSGRR